MVFGELVSWSANPLNGTGTGVDEWAGNRIKNLEDVWGVQVTRLHIKGLQDRTEAPLIVNAIGVSYKAAPLKHGQGRGMEYLLWVQRTIFYFSQ